MKIIALVVFLLASIAPVRGVAQWANWSTGPEPVFRGQYPAVGDPGVIREAGIYRMFYTCYDPNRQGPVICEATSTDGLSWKNVDVGGEVHGRLLDSRPGNWDEHHEGCFAVRRGSEYLLYYSGYRDSGGIAKGFPASLAAARSSDGKNFVRVSDGPVLSPTDGGYDNDAVYSPTIIDYEGGLLMIYVGHCYSKCDKGAGAFLLAATSQDGISWTKRAEPVLQASDTIWWMKNGVAEPALVRAPDGSYYLFLTGALGDDEKKVIGVARSSTPFGPWDINPDPIVTPSKGSAPGTYRESGVLAPTVIIEGDRARMWFFGFNKKPEMAIGYAEARLPIKQ